MSLAWFLGTYAVFVVLSWPFNLRISLHRDRLPRAARILIAGTQTRAQSDRRRGVVSGQRLWCRDASRPKLSLGLREWAACLLFKLKKDGTPLHSRGSGTPGCWLRDH